MIQCKYYYQYFYSVSCVLYYRGECAIPSVDSVILTGGVNTMDRVSRYGLTGHLSDLASLLVGREYHGCGGYYRQDTGTQVGICKVCIINE